MTFERSKTCIGKESPLSAWQEPSFTENCGEMYPVMSCAAALSSAQCQALLEKVICKCQLEIVNLSAIFGYMCHFQLKVPFLVKCAIFNKCFLFFDIIKTQNGGTQSGSI